MTSKYKWVRTETATASVPTDVWELRDGDEMIAELSRVWPSRYHGNGVSGLVVDRAAPKSWEVTLWKGDEHEHHVLTRGISLAEVKSATVALLPESKSS